jgi:molecular chaperone Hsp33
MNLVTHGGLADDALAPFLFEGAAVRGALVRLDATSRDVLACHSYPPPLARALAELLAAAALLASTLKLDGSLIVQLSGDGPVRLIVVECNEALELRATAQWDGPRVAALGDAASLADLAGGTAHARLTLTLDQRNAGTLYQGIVSLDATSIAASIEHYLATSEQLQSRLWLFTEGESVSGLILQRLPASIAADAATWTRLCGDMENGVRAIYPGAVAGLGTDASGKIALTPFCEGVRLREDPAGKIALTPFLESLRALFPHDDIRMFDARKVTFRCKCTVGRVANALRIAGREEVEASLAERGAVEVTCEFCNRKYTFAPHEARALFTTAAMPLRRSSSSR